MPQTTEGGELTTRLHLLFGTPRSQWADPEEYVSPTTPPTITVKELTHLWLNAGAILAEYSDDQVAQGPDIIINTSWSDYAFPINDEAVSDTVRDHCIRAISHVFSDVFAPRCGAVSPDETNADWSALDGLCYMWWDIFPFIHPTCLEVMRHALQLDSLMCWRSAFHGLSHWHTAHPAVVEQIIDEFLARHDSRSPDVQRAALEARAGGGL